MEESSQISFPSTGDPQQDASLLHEYELQDRWLKQNICPNGCGQMTIADAFNRDCPTCGFHGWSNAPHGFFRDPNL